MSRYKIRKWAAGRKNNLTAVLLILAGCMINVLLGIILYYRGLQGLPVHTPFYKQNPFSTHPLAPIEVIASCLIFAGFSMMKISRDYSKMAGYTFLIYLFHPGVIEVLRSLFRASGGRLTGSQLVEAIATPVIAILIFGVSLIAAIIYKKLQFEEHLTAVVQNSMIKKQNGKMKTTSKE